MSDWDVYLEDSAVSKPGRYTGIGGVMLKTGHALRLHDSIAEWRVKQGIVGEIAWKKITRDNVESYKVFAGGALHYIHHGDMSFSYGRFDREDNQYFLYHKKSEARDKQVYQLLLHRFALRVSKDDRVFVYPDMSLIRGSVEELRRILNAGIAKSTGWRGVNIVRSIQPLESHENHFVQMSDILVGAVTSANNKLHDLNSGRGAAKQALIDHIELKVGEPLTVASTEIRTKFDKWFFQPQIKIASESPTTSAEPRVQSDHTTPDEL